MQTRGMLLEERQDGSFALTLYANGGEHLLGTLDHLHAGQSLKVELTFERTHDLDLRTFVQIESEDEPDGIYAVEARQMDA